jgi:hypothetical protein
MYTSGQPSINSSPMWLRVTAIAAFLVTFVLSMYFGVNTFHLNIADNYTIYVLPPRWTFKIIWVAICILYAGVLLYAALKDKWPSNAYWASIGVSLLTALWIGVFARGTPGSNIASLLITATQFAVLYTLWNILYEPLQ